MYVRDVLSGSLGSFDFFSLCGGLRSFWGGCGVSSGFDCFRFLEGGWALLGSDCTEKVCRSFRGWAQGGVGSAFVEVVCCCDCVEACSCECVFSFPFLALFLPFFAELWAGILGVVFSIEHRGYEREIAAQRCRGFNFVVYCNASQDFGISSTARTLMTPTASPSSQSSCLDFHTQVPSTMNS